MTPLSRRWKGSEIGLRVKIAVRHLAPPNLKAGRINPDMYSSASALI
jgi:hypothetical protein